MGMLALMMTMMMNMMNMMVMEKTKTIGDNQHERIHSNDSDDDNDVVHADPK